MTYISKMSIPGKLSSIWMETTPETNFPTLTKDIETDVLVIGAGIVGVTTAFNLLDSGKKVTLIDWSKVVSGVTGHTTAKATSLHGLIYRDLIKTFSEKEARLHYEAQERAIDTIEEISNKLGIDCDFKRTFAVTFAESKEYSEKIKEEVEAAEKIGANSSYVLDIPLNIKSFGGVRFENQGQFHPRKYCLGLIDELRKAGVEVYENTKALKLEKGDTYIVQTENARIRAKDVVVATHVPFFKSPGGFFSKLYQIHSYVLAISINDEIPEGMFYGTGTHTIRNQNYDNEIVLIAGGEDHKVGQGGDIEKRYLSIVDYYSKVFDVKGYKLYWSTQDPDSPDRLPYIGKISDHLYMASGFSGWGMTNGTVSGMLISDLIKGKDSELKELYNPNRKNWKASAGRFLKENANVAGAFMGGKFSKEEEIDVKQLKPGEGRKGKLNGETVGAYKDENGKVFIISPFCTFEGCELSWNNAEKTWDCPCCGSRFSYDGKTILGPTVHDLKSIYQS